MVDTNYLHVMSFIDYCKWQHDKECNQKYDKTLPYSFHLNLVAIQAKSFDYLLTKYEYAVAINAAWGHDLIEDARITYNDIKNYLISYSSGKDTFNGLGTEVAEVIYACTELRGRNRDERKGPEYFRLLKEDKIATYVKLCDIIANVSYSLLTNSGMYSKYQKEFIHLETELYREDLKPMFTYLQKLLTIKND